VACSDNYCSTLDTLRTNLNAYCATILYSDARYARVEVKFATALDNLATHIGNNSWQTVRADVRVRLVEYLLCSAVIYKALQCSIVVASLL
jgi:hypothetical protein